MWRHKGKKQRMKVLWKNWSKMHYGYRRKQEEVGCDGLWVSGQVVQRMGNHRRTRSEITQNCLCKVTLRHLWKMAWRWAKHNTDRHWFMIKLILDTSTFEAKRSHPFWNYQHVKTIVQGLFIPVNERDCLWVKKGRTGLCSCRPVSKWDGNIVTQRVSCLGLQTLTDSLCLHKAWNLGC